jgi:cutinase
MKFTAVLSLLLGVVSAMPLEVETGSSAVVTRQADEVMTPEEVQAAEEYQMAQVVQAAGFLSRNDLEDGDASRCPKAILIFARGSLELSNMGLLAGPSLASALKQQLGNNNIWVQGVGGPYKALLTPNFLPEGTNRQSIDEGKRLFRLAHTKCPNAKILASGYSQGTAVVGNAISEIESDIRNKIVGTALFGYTKNIQNKGAIRNYPQDRVSVFCAALDAVCFGTLFILPDHFFYADEASGPAADFLVSKL